jgi:predicted amidophosphoribosyltransferase
MGEWSLPETSEPDDAKAPARFIWPPRTTPVEVPKPKTREAEADPSPKNGIPESRPPRAERPAVPVRVPHFACAPASSKLSRGWSEIEHTWLDVVASPLAQRMAEEYWTPDSPADYCTTCALSVGKHDAIDGLCAACREGETTRPPWQRIIRLGEYESPLSRWICEVKFTRWRKLGRDLGRVLGDSIQVQMQEAAAVGAIPPGPPIIVPVPMSLLRRFSRGIDHTLAIARGVADRTGGTVLQPITRDHRPSQTLVAPSRREANVAGSFRPKAWRRPRLGGRLVIVLDDVTTTTSTLRGACRAVGERLRAERQAEKAHDRGKPAPIWGAVLARTPLDRHDAWTDVYDSAQMS